MKRSPLGEGFNSHKKPKTRRRPTQWIPQKKTLRKLGSAAKREQRLLCQFGATLKTCFPHWQDWLNAIEDPRDPLKCSYTLPDLLWMSLLMLLAGLESRNQFNQNLCTEETQTLLQNTLGLKLPSLPHGDTLAYLWKQLPPEAFDTLRTAMIRTLLRSRRLEAFRYRKQFYILALDGTELYRWNERHCDQCLHAATGPNKKLQYYHRVLELKLVSHDGLALSVLTEFIENTGGPDDKQDCELKAAYRLLKRLKELCPQLKILLLADGIYPNGPIFRLCQDSDWKYLFSLQDESLKTVWQDFEALINMPLNALGVKDPDPILDVGNRRYRWQNALSYQGEQFDGLVNVMDVLKPNEQGVLERCRGFISNLRLSEQRIQEIETLAQQRWKIENQGFDVQKRHGYALEHVWCRDPNAMKIVYLLIQIAHLLNQLMLKADLLGAFRELGSLKTYYNQWLLTLTQSWTPTLEQMWGYSQSCTYQIRWQI